MPLTLPDHPNSMPMESPIEPHDQPPQLLEGVALRSATPRDIRAIMAIQNQGIEDRIATVDSEVHTLEDQSEWYQSHGPSEPILIAEHGHEVIGWASLSRFSPRKAYGGVKELSIYVERKWRGKGVGGMMLEHLLQKARQLDIYKIILNALPFNQQAIALYRKFGFRTVGVWRNQGKLGDQWVDVVLMEKHLRLPGLTTSPGGHLRPQQHRDDRGREPASSRPVVVKIGGSTLGSHDTTLEDLATLQQQGITPVVVHGGGKTITEWMAKQGIKPRFVRGLRVTDAQNLDIVVAVLTGLINKDLVASLQALGAKAVGISGVDGGMLQAKVADPQLGLVGQIVKVNPEPIFQILNTGNIPVIAPVALHLPEESGRGGAMLNINADTAAGEIAAALGTHQLIFLTDVPGIIDSSRRVISRLTRLQAKALIDSGTVAGGMTPKVEASLKALDRIRVAQIIDGRRPRALLDSLEGTAPGTRIR